MVEHNRTNLSYYHGLQAAQYRLNPKSIGFDPEFNFKNQAKKLFETKDEVKEFLQAVDDYRQSITAEEVAK